MTIEEVWQMYDDVCQANASLQDQLEAKEAELKGALIIPEGWSLLAIECLTMGYLCTIQREGYNLTNHDEVSSVKPTVVEALRNALEQIENTKN